MIRKKIRSRFTEYQSYIPPLSPDAILNQVPEYNSESESSEPPTPSEPPIIYNPNFTNTTLSSSSSSSSSSLENSPIATHLSFNSEQSDSDPDSENTPISVIHPIARKMIDSQPPSQQSKSPLPPLSMVLRSASVFIIIIIFIFRKENLLLQKETSILQVLTY